MNKISLFSIFKKFLYIGSISFGGGIIAYVRELIVKNEKWLTEDEFLVLLSIGQTMPGLNSVNVAILLGDKLRGPLGSIAAFLGICLPGSFFVMLLGAFYLDNGNHPIVNKVLTGVTAGATALLAYVTWDLGKRNFKTSSSLFVACLTFFLMSVIKMPLYFVILVVMPLALFLFRPLKVDKNE